MYIYILARKAYHTKGVIKHSWYFQPRITWCAGIRQDGNKNSFHWATKTGNALRHLTLLAHGC